MANIGAIMGHKEHLAQEQSEEDKGEEVGQDGEAEEDLSCYFVRLYTANYTIGQFHRNRP